jgi:DNA-binding NtrC family response regulator
MVERGEFRSDLYHRLNVLQIPVPPLRERTQDIPLLVDLFLGDATRKQGRKIWLEPTAMTVLELHEWRGNVRELKNVIERMAAMSSPGPLGEAEVRRTLACGLAEQAPLSNAETLEDAEREHVLEALRLCGGNRTLAAERLGIQRRTLYKKLERWGLLHEGHTSVPETQGSQDEEKD